MRGRSLRLRKSRRSDRRSRPVLNTRVVCRAPASNEGAVLNRSISFAISSLSVHLPDTILDVSDAAHTADTGPRPGPALWRIRPDSHTPARPPPDLAEGHGARPAQQPKTAFRGYCPPHRARRKGAGQG